MQFLKFLVLTAVVYLSHSAQLLAQSVGIGTTTPLATLEVQAVDSNLLTLSNISQLTIDTKASLFLKNGNFYTAGIKTIGTSNSSARLAFFTFADPDSNDLRERFSILDNGRVGIGTISPVTSLDVAGNGRFTALNVSGGALLGTNTGVSYLNSGLRGRAEAVGVVGEGLSNAGVGVAGYNVGGASQPDFFAGSGVFGYSSVGHGVVGQSARVGFAGVFGTARANEAIGGLFSAGESFTNTLALRTVGNIRLGGIGEGFGRILTSDGLGNATWQAPPAVAKAFSARLTSNLVLTNSNTVALGTMTELFDEGNMFSSGTNSFTAPEAGIYHLSFSAIIGLQGVTSNFTFGSEFIVNGNNVTGLFNTSHAEGGPGGNLTGHHNSRLLKLAAGDVVQIQVTASFVSGTVTLRGSNSANTTVLSVHQVK